jgi:predicted DNA-binding transcriptional regulator YafY
MRDASETRNDFRSFRLDRIAEAEVTDEIFTLAPGQTLEDFLDRVDPKRRTGPR